MEKVCLLTHSAMELISASAHLEPCHGVSPNILDHLCSPLQLLVFHHLFQILNYEFQRHGLCLIGALIRVLAHRRHTGGLIIDKTLRGEVILILPLQKVNGSCLCGYVSQEILKIIIRPCHLRAGHKRYGKGPQTPQVLLL